MNAERWGRIREVYVRVADLPEPARAAALAQACGADAALRAEVARLLAIPAAPDEFIEPPPRAGALGHAHDTRGQGDARDQREARGPGAERRRAGAAARRPDVTTTAAARRQALLTAGAIGLAGALMGWLGAPGSASVATAPQGRVVVRVDADGPRAQVRAWPLEQAEPGGTTRALALGWTDDGVLEAALPAGPYRLVVERGPARAECLRLVPEDGVLALRPTLVADAAALQMVAAPARDETAPAEAALSDASLAHGAPPANHAPPAPTATSLPSTLLPVDLLQSGADGSGAGIRVVRVPALLVDREPVGNADYLAFVEATGAARPAGWPDDATALAAAAADPAWARAPVTGVDADAARAFAEWSGARLPTLAERLAAARAPDARLAVPDGLLGELVDGPCLVEDAGHLRPDPERTWAVPADGSPAQRVARTVPQPGIGFRRVRTADA